MTAGPSEKPGIDVMGGPSTSFGEKVLATIRAHRMMDPGDKVLVAVSGGPDSVCLLHVLHSLGYPLEVAHFDHQTREGESGADAAFVRDLAGSFSVPFHIESRPVQAEAEASALSFEEYARKSRYDFLVRCATARGCAVIATGHQADDQAETLLMRILRGTTPRGLAGIPPVRKEGSVRIVRPLIACSREAILAYLREQRLAHRTDRSNVDPRHFRNKVRHELLPHLCGEYNPRLREALCRLAEVQRCENDLLNSMAQAFLEAALRKDGSLERRHFAALHPAVQRRVVLLLGWRHGVDCAFERVEEAVRFIVEAPTGQAFDLGGGVLLRNGRETTEVAAGREAVDETVIPLSVPGATAAFGKQFRARFLANPPAEDLASYCTPRRQVFDADALSGQLAVRHRRPGDRFTPYGMRGTKKLKDYFIDLGIPVSQREAQLILTADDRIVWIVGHAVSAEASVTPRTGRLLEIEVDDAAE